ncbi:hypothetical protein DACRYDRAFT_99024 [Dacryopinax primogenitus]|uniref:SEC7 domain-containing protein n=1 Tax=Dacryopinax primogenitus (strain DJM 731) TaxID=1858805 RepID=M5GD96_DACPD|nr:uncharacterized protein DACRYDRAFT_99024 [Dacryopinax primogenitus]EJU04372.1 hypothetical protein DACRYDRAFT_99024 [Dacryopinax primogenitus]
MATSASRSPSASSVRADAISRLKRAASLPRMKDGRRPAIPANGGAFSEGARSEEGSMRGADTPTYGYGDRSQSETDMVALVRPHEQEMELSHENVVEYQPTALAEDDLPTPTPREDVNDLHHAEHDVSITQAATEVHEKKPEIELEPVTVPEQTGEEEEEEEQEEEEHDEPPSQLPTAEEMLLLGLQQQMQIQRVLAGLPAAFPPSSFPTGFPPSAFPQNAFQTGLPNHQPTNQLEVVIGALLSQQQQHLQQQQQQQAASSSQPRVYRPPTSPVGWQQPIKSPASPLPSLNDLAAAHQRGLFRSNSAAARTEAYSKLTGGRETPMISPPASVLGQVSMSRLGRSHTVTGGERMAAGGRMVGVISRRQKQEDQNRAPSAMDMTTSAGEESSVSVTTREERRSRRRRRHSSQSKAVVVDDRDVPTNAPSTPAPSGTPLPQEDIPPLPPRESISSLSAANALRQSIEKRGARDNFEYDYERGRAKSATPVYYGSKPGTDVETDNEIPPVPRSPTNIPTSPSLSDLGRPLPTTPLFTGLPYPSAPYLTSQSGTHNSDGASHASSGYMDGIPVYLRTGSLQPARDSFPHTIEGTPYSLPYKSSPNGENHNKIHRAITPGYDSAAESPWNLGAGSEFHGALGDTRGRNIMDQFRDEGEEKAETGALLVESLPEPTSLGSDSANTVRAAITPSPLPPMPLTAPATITGMSSQQMQFPTAVSPSPRAPTVKPAHREVLSDISFTSVPPASTPHRSRTESVGMSDFDIAITDGETTGREDRPKKRRSGSNFSDKVKSFLSHMSSRTALRPRTTSISSRHERQQKTESNNSGELLGGKLENVESRESREKRESRDSREKQVAQFREGLLTKSVSAVSLPSQASPQFSKSLMDVTTPMPQGSISPLPPASAAQIAKYTDDKLLPFPGMLRLEQERSKLRTLSPPTSPTNLSFSPPPTSPPPGTQTTIRSGSAKLGTPSPGMTLLDLPSTPTSAPATPGTLGERMGERTLHYIDLGDNLLAGSETLPTTRRGVQQWLRMKKSSPNGNGAVQKKSSLTDLLSSGMLNESPIEKDDGAGLFGKLSIGRNTNKKSIRPRLPERQDGRAGASSSTDIPQVPIPFPAPVAPPAQISIPRHPEDSHVSTALSLVPSQPSAMLPTKPSSPAPLVPVSDQPAVVVASASNASNSLASLAAVAATYQEKSNNQSALASLADAAAVSDQPEDSHSSLASDPSGPNSHITDLSISALSTPSVSHETSSTSQPSLDSPPRVQLPHLKQYKSASTPPAGSLSLNIQPSSRTFSPKPSPPRKLLLHSPVLQVVQGDRLKERHLFLFSDILVIAKPDLRSSLTNEKGDPGSLSRPLLVKSIVEHRNLCIKPQQDHVEPVKSDKHKLTMRAFADEFAENPTVAVTKLAQRAGLQDDPGAIADVLFETPSLDKRQLGEYLCQRSSRYVLRAFIDRFGFEDVRIDIALRTFLLSIILPDQEENSDHLLNNFAARWWSANSRTIGFDRELSTRLVLAMIQLSEALHSASSVSSGKNGAMSPNKPRISVQDWIETFRIRDTRQLVPELLLRAIYTGISRFRIAESLDSNSDSEVPAAMIPARMKTRLTHGEPSERIHIRIPRPDRNFAIRLYGHGLKFDPEYLDFSNSTEQSFVIFPTTVGPKTIIFGREGGNSAFYTGVPLSKTVLVERAFMKNTFQLAFVNHLGVKRKYLFSMDDLFRVTEWTNTLSREINKRKSMEAPLREKDAERKAAADVIAFVTLRDLLLPREEKEPNSSAADTSAASYSRIGPPKSPAAKESPSDDRAYTGQQIIQTCIQNSLLASMILRAKPAKADGNFSDLEKRTPTPRLASPLTLTPRIRPGGMRMF